MLEASRTSAASSAAASTASPGRSTARDLAYFSYGKIDDATRQEEAATAAAAVAVARDADTSPLLGL